MAHSLNNAKAAQFMERTASFSTHGSRRGFVDIELPIPDTQLNDADGERDVLVRRMAFLGKQIRENKTLMGLSKNNTKPLRRYREMAERGEFRGSKEKSKILLETLPLAEEFTALMEQRKTLGPATRRRGESDCFIEAAREMLTPALFQQIWTRAHSIHDTIK